MFRQDGQGMGREDTALRIMRMHLLALRYITQRATQSEGALECGTYLCIKKEKLNMNTLIVQVCKNYKARKIRFHGAL